METKVPSSLKIPETMRIPMALIAGAVLGGLLVWGIMREGPGSSSKKTEISPASQTSEETPVLAPEENSGTQNPLSIHPQPAGFVVIVSYVRAENPLWVVIYEDNGGQPGNALGAARFTSEKTSGLVQLLRGTLPQSTYYGVLHRDDGDRIFSLESDFPLRDGEGNPVMVRFMTQ